MAPSLLDLVNVSIASFTLGATIGVLYNMIARNEFPSIKLLAILSFVTATIILGQFL
jgi:hypothetical protein